MFGLMLMGLQDDSVEVTLHRQYASITGGIASDICVDLGFCAGYMSKDRTNYMDLGTAPRVVHSETVYGAVRLPKLARWELSSCCVILVIYVPDLIDTVCFSS